MASIKSSTSLCSSLSLSQPVEEASEAAVEVALQRSTPLLSFVFQALIDLVPGESHAHLFFCKKPARPSLVFSLAFFVRKVASSYSMVVKKGDLSQPFQVGTILPPFM